MNSDVPDAELLVPLAVYIARGPGRADGTAQEGPDWPSRGVQYRRPAGRGAGRGRAACRDRIGPFEMTGAHSQSELATWSSVQVMTAECVPT